MKKKQRKKKVLNKKITKTKAKSAFDTLEKKVPPTIIKKLSLSSPSDLIINQMMIIVIKQIKRYGKKKKKFY